MTPFEKELISALKDFEDRKIDLVSWMERTKQAVSTHIIGQNNYETYEQNVLAVYQNQQRQALGDKA